MSLVSSDCAHNLSITPDSVRLQSINCDFVESNGFVIFEEVLVQGGDSNFSHVNNVKAHVLPRMPLGVDLIIGLDVVLREGLSIIKDDEGSMTVRLGSLANCGAIIGHCDTDSLESVESPTEKFQKITEDLDITFAEDKWTVKWKWTDCSPPLNNRRCNYSVPDEHRDAFNQEVQQWVDEGILVPWERERDGELKNILPLMSVKQEKGTTTKIRPVLDFRFLNEYIVSRPGGAIPLCEERLRRWRKASPNFAMVDLKKAYLQIVIDPSLWCYQGVRWGSQTCVDKTGIWTECCA